MNKKIVSSVQHLLLWIMLLAMTLLFFTSFQLPPLLSSPIDQETSQPRVIFQEGLMNIGIPIPFLSEEIVERIGVDTWRDAGWLGENQKIGVIDHGFGRLQEFESDFNVSVRTRQPLESYEPNPITHGTDAMQIIHAIAPAAELFACQYTSFTEYSDCVTWMETDAGVKIIEHSAGVPWLAANGSNPWVERATAATNNGILWVNSAGDYANGTLSMRYTSAGNGVHQFLFTTDEPEWVDVAPLVDGQYVFLTWESNSIAEANQIDFQLVLEYLDDSTVHYSEQPQRGDVSDLPVDWIYVEQGRPFRLQIRTQDNVPDGVPLLFFVPFTNLPQTNISYSVISPSDSDSVLTVGAMQGVDIAPYSGRGLSLLGSIKPDMIAPGEIYLVGNRLFYGTITAASVVAGTAALVWEANPFLSQQEILEFFRTDALFRNRPNIAQGGGYLALRPPMSTPTPTLIYSLTPTPTGLPTDTPNPVFRLIPAENFPIARVLAESAYLREGPGVNFQIVGSAFRDDQFAVTGQQSDWYQVRYPNENLLWIASSVVEILPENVTIRNAEQLPIPPATQSVPATPTFVPRTPPATPAPPQIENVTIVVRTVIVTATPMVNIPATITTQAPDNPTLSTIIASPLPADCGNLSDTSGFAVVAQNIDPVNVRLLPSTDSTSQMRLTCAGTRYVQFYQRTTCSNGYIWLRSQSGWIRSDVVRTVNSQIEAESEAGRICVPTPVQTIATAIATPTNTLRPGETPPTPTSTATPTSPPPAPSFYVDSIGGVGTAASGGCIAVGHVSGPSDMSGRICIMNDAVMDCNRTFASPPPNYILDFGGVGQNHRVWAETNYGTLEAGTFLCPP